jgi:predicted permease
MIRKKNRFFTFLFSLLPGAGQMYMGFMKRGLCLMSCFFLLLFISTWLNISPIMFIVAIVWFYSFFDTHNLRSTPDEEFYAIKDEYILFPEFLKDKYHILQDKYRNLFAIALIIVGITVLWNNVYNILWQLVPNNIGRFLYKVGYYLPQLAIGCAIILLGIYLIKGKKQELDKEETYPKEILQLPESNSNETLGGSSNENYS